MKYLLVLVLLLVGCTQTVTPSTSQSAQPTPPMPATSTPSADPTCSPMGGTPYPCSADEHQKVQEQNRLTEEAIALYRRWTKESTRLYRAGGTTKTTPEMLATTAGEFRKSVLAIFRDLRNARAKAVSGELRIMTIGPDLKDNLEPRSAAIRACVDARSISLEREGKKLRSGTIFVEYAIAKMVEGELRLWSVSSGKVESC